MAAEMTGLYVPAEKVRAWQARLAELTAQMNELVREVSGVDCIEIQVRRALPKAPAKAAKAVKEPAVEKPEPMAKAVPAPQASQPEPSPKLKKEPGPPRQRFGKLREQLILDHGLEVANHMVQMCGDDRVTLTLRRHVQRFLGTHPDDRAAAMAYCAAKGVENPEELGTEDVLSELSDVMKHDDGRVSLWANEGDEGQLRKHRGADEASESYDEQAEVAAAQ